MVSWSLITWTVPCKPSWLIIQFSNRQSRLVVTVLEENIKSPYTYVVIEFPVPKQS